MRTALQLIAGLTVAAGVLWLGFAWSFRSKLRPVLDVVRRLNRRVTNPRVVRTAGRPGASASLIHHVGRTSGTPYRTPVVAVPNDDGFVVALPYGPSADWVRNVLAAGSATVEHEGRVVAVAGPRLVRARDVRTLFSAKEQRTQRLYGVDDVLVLPRSTEHDGATAPAS